MNTTEKLQSLLQETFKMSSFRASQQKIIQHLLKGKHCLVLMPTGMGKSLCYQLPALLQEGLTVVLSPLIALMKDQVDKLQKLGIDAAYINSSLGKGEREKRYRNLSQGKYKLLFVAPERFRNQGFISVIQQREVSLLAIDEAHCASQWGNDFRPDYARISEFREILKNPTTIGLTATATPQVQHDIIEKMGFDRASVTIFNEGISRPNLHLSVMHVLDEQEKFSLLLKHISQTSGSCIIYFNLIKGLETFSHFLEEKKIKHLVYHGKLYPERRRTVQKKFLEANTCLMLATNAFGMGIDKPDIRKIIHAELPDSIEAYYQEIGRAGRDGNPSEALLLYEEQDLGVQLQFLEWKNPDTRFIKTTYTLLQSLGSALHSFTYEDLQEKLVFKNRGDHRLQTVLNLFDRYAITRGSLDTCNLEVAAPLPEHLVSEESQKTKLDSDRQRLYQIFQYVKSSACRKEYIHTYFNMEPLHCGNCDNCQKEPTCN